MADPSRDSSAQPPAARWALGGLAALIFIIILLSIPNLDVLGVIDHWHSRNRKHVIPAIHLCELAHRAASGYATTAVRRHAWLKLRTILGSVFSLEEDGSPRKAGLLGDPQDPGCVYQGTTRPE
jgi:hypothetical protein